MSDIVIGAVRELMVVRHFFTKVEGESTDAVVGESVFQHDRHVACAV